MKVEGYLLRTENLIRIFKGTPKENYADGLREDYFGTIMKEFKFSEDDKFYQYYQAEIGKKYSDLVDENYDFKLVLKDLKKAKM